MHIKSTHVLPATALLGAVVVHYVFYAFSYVWFLTGADYRNLHVIYGCFVAIVLAEFFLRAPWWLMWATAWAALVVPTLTTITFHLSPGMWIIPLGALIASPFVVVATLRRRQEPKV
ncbi:hypothetical protein KPL74_09105 [Bacillus sp. NP157]|nr:hypothetical protein KPL74_09105 [Bacillus sp. NP157]